MTKAERREVLLKNLKKARAAKRAKHNQVENPQVLNEAGDIRPENIGQVMRDESPRIVRRTVEILLENGETTTDVSTFPLNRR